MNAKLIDEKPKRSPRLLIYALILLIVGSALVAGWIHVNQLEKKKQQQQILEAEAVKKQLEVQRDACLAEAEQKYYRYLELNGEKIKNKDGSISYRLPQHKIGVAFTELKEAEEQCFEKYLMMK